MYIPIIIPVITISILMISFSLMVAYLLLILIIYLLDIAMIYRPWNLLADFLNIYRAFKNSKWPNRHLIKQKLTEAKELLNPKN
jgi:hypothetical protein